MAINLPQFSEDMDIIQKLGDTPGTDNNLDWKQLQAKFDEAGNLVKAYLNSIVPLLNAAFRNEGAVITGGTVIGDLDVNGNRLFGIATPTADSDAASKKYVDSAVEVAKDASLPKAGGTMTGDISMGGNTVKWLKAPTSGTDAATKDYVDGKRVAYTATLGTSWTGSGPYTQTVAVAGILATDMPHIMPVYDAANATAIAQKEAWSCVSKAEAAAGGIKFTCFEDKPGAEIPLQIEVVR